MVEFSPGGENKNNKCFQQRELPLFKTRRRGRRSLFIIFYFLFALFAFRQPSLRVDPPALFRHRIIAEFFIDKACKRFCGALLAMNYKYMLRFSLNRCQPVYKLVFICVSTDSRKIYYICFDIDLLTEKLYLLCSI